MSLFDLKKSPNWINERYVIVLADCLFIDQNLVGMGYSPIIVDSEGSCQKSCQDSAACMAWSYSTTSSECMRKSASIALTPEQNVVSGSRYCRSKLYASLKS